MPRLSIYLPDELAARAQSQESNLSQLVQSALRRLLDEPPGYVRRPEDADALLAQARPALAEAARQEYADGYAAALRRLPDLPWWALDELADVGFGLERWVATWRSGVAHAAVDERATATPDFFWKLAEDLRSLVDPIGYDQYSGSRTRAWRRGYSDGLRAAYDSVEHGDSRVSESSAGDGPAGAGSPPGGQRDDP